MDGHIQLDERKEDLHVLEIKSMNDASWKKFQKEGVKKSHPRYYSQLQMMMGMSQMRTSFFIAINKNTSEYHSEIVDYDDLEFMFIKERIERVLLNKARKISNDETDWRCRGCFKRGACWGQIDVPKSCTTCKFAIAKSDGDWHCQKHGRSARELCNFYELYEPLPKGS
jgi:rubrerythrin